MFQKELPLVAFLEQETFAFFTPGFPLQSGLGIYVQKKHSLIRILCNFKSLNFFFLLKLRQNVQASPNLKIRFYPRFYQVNLFYPRYN
jgi:hypothetical protein